MSERTKTEILLEDVKRVIKMNMEEQKNLIQNIMESARQIDVDNVPNAVWEMSSWRNWIDKIDLIETQTDQLLKIACRLKLDLDE